MGREGLPLPSIRATACGFPALGAPVDKVYSEAGSLPEGWLYSIKLAPAFFYRLSFLDFHREQPFAREEGVWPSLVTSLRLPKALPLIPSQRQNSKSSADNAIHYPKHAFSGALEVFEPSPQRPVEVYDDNLKTSTTISLRELSYPVLYLG
jgi:hypothetical protein